MLNLTFSWCLGIYPAISAQFSLETRVAAKNREKFTKHFYCGDSWPFKVIDADSSSTVLVMVSSMSVPICNHFTLDEPIGVKYILGGYLSFTPSFEENSLT